jgi:hypothetical protein
LDTGVLIGIIGVVVGIIGLAATIVFGIVGPLVIRNRLSQRQKTGIQSGRDTIIKGPAIFDSKTPDANSDEFRIAVAMTIILVGVSIFYIWDKSHPIELQQTFLLQLAFPVMLILLVIVPLLWVWLFLKMRY